MRKMMLLAAFMLATPAAFAQATNQTTTGQAPRGPQLPIPGDVAHDSGMMSPTIPR